MADRDSMPTLAYNECPVHGFASISIDDEHGGVRVTPGKCCGRWRVVREWPLTPSAWTELAGLAEVAAEEAESMIDREACDAQA